ncbi:MAG: DUF192 domain-containing protein [Balneolales bacterium]
MNSYISIFIALFLVSLTSACGNDNNSSSTKGRSLDFNSELYFLNQFRDTVSTIQVAIAETENKRNLGLMDVYNLPSNAGMIFIFNNEQPRSFWMKNTPLPLDIIYINRDREIVKIHHNTVPFSERQIPSGEPAQYVVEVNGGYTQNYNIQEGMYIDF